MITKKEAELARDLLKDMLGMVEEIRNWPGGHQAWSDILGSSVETIQLIVRTHRMHLGAEVAACEDMCLVLHNNMSRNDDIATFVSTTTPEKLRADHASVVARELIGLMNVKCALAWKILKAHDELWGNLTEIGSQ